MTGRPLIFGEVLFDRFPDGSEVLGGAPFNTAWHLQGFGVAPLLVSRVGADPAGHRVLAAMHDWGMDCAAVETDPERATGRVDVELAAGEPRYRIDPDQAYGHIRASGATGGRPGLLYHGSLALWRPDSRRALDDLTRRLGAPIFLDVNLRPPWWRADDLEAWLERATWAKLNEDELACIEGAAGSVAERAARLCRRFDLRRVVVTLGAAGAQAVDVEAGEATVRPAASGPVVDTVGAGDAFSAVLMLGLLAGWDLGASLQRAQSFASAIVGVRGATVADAAFYRPFLDAWSAP
ncbi:carbohydrate kinase [Parasulfuritortus cantonensis]|uniref:Carbohydrate kinase n=1 Tax=Parasulfuritortus cantonensis TaxID=2528202 RepID=A0A4R1BM07_9PROT|nr:PfkB family carbohydrate kinase [Parasulfuritortus cantonensis]TCJ18491.1 carbohydrate kinase [Parasulfuritortus cantonensis]